MKNFSNVKHYTKKACGVNIINHFENRQTCRFLFFIQKYYQIIFNVHKYYESYYVIYNTIVHNKGDNHYAKFSKH